MSTESVLLPAPVLRLVWTRSGSRDLKSSPSPSALHHQRVGWDIDGDFFAHDFSISREGREIVVIHKEWLTWGDCYVLDIADPRDTVTALAVVLAIDCVQAAAASQAASANGH